MRYFSVLLVMFFIIFSFCGKPKQKVEKKPSVLDSVLMLSKKQPKHILIEFYTKTCPWCKKLENYTFKDSSVKEFLKDYYLIRVDAQEDTALTNKFGIVGYPTVVLCKPDGEEIDRFHYEDPENFIKKVNDYLNGKGTLSDLLNKFKEDSTNLDLIYEIADKYTYRNKPEEAKKYFSLLFGLVKEDTSGYKERALYGIANALRRSKQYDSAFVYFEKVYKEFKKSELAPDALYYLGYCKLKLGDKEGARKYWEEYLKVYPNSSDTSYVRKKLESLNK